MSERRDVRPEEMPAIVRLATRFPDLRDVEAELDRRDVETESDGPIRPRNVPELLKLLEAKVIARHEARQLLGYRGWESRLPWLFRDSPKLR